jgi:RND family efflux transporter MFP subunit
MLKSFPLILFGASLTLLTACSPPEKDAVDETNKPVPVRITEIASQELPIVVESVGRLAANREVTIATELGGKIVSYHADVGDEVKAGQILARLDPTDYLLALQEAKTSLDMAAARLEAATKSMERVRDLLPQKVIAAEAFDKAEEHYNTCKASVEQSQILINISKERVNKTRHKAPFDGTIAARMIETGQTVAVGSPIFLLVDLNPMRVKVSLSEDDYIRLDKDDPVSVRLEASPEMVFKGRVDRIDIKADERTNTFGVQIIVDNPNLFLKAGMTARVHLTVDVIPDAVMIPQSTVLYREDRQELFVVAHDQTAEVRQVTLGRTERGLVQAVQGLAPGDRLVVTGGQYLKQGDRVRITAGP